LRLPVLEDFHHQEEAEMSVRYHRKADGIIRIDARGKARYLTPFEHLLYVFGLDFWIS
jgi:hypothetical protein